MEQRETREGPKAQGRGQDNKAPEVQEAVAAGQARPLGQRAMERGAAKGHEAMEGWPLEVLRHVEGRKRPRKKDAVVQVEKDRLRRGSGGGEEAWRVGEWPCP